MKKLIIAGKEFNSRLFLGTGKFNSNTVMEEAILASGCEMVTVAMKRIELDDKEDDMLKHIIHPHIQLFVARFYRNIESNRGTSQTRFRRIALLPGRSYIMQTAGRGRSSNRHAACRPHRHKQRLADT